MGMIGKRVESVQTGEPGTVTKVINRCYWVAMDDGRNMSGHKQYWKATKKQLETEAT